MMKCERRKARNERNRKERGKAHAVERKQEVLVTVFHTGRTETESRNDDRCSGAVDVRVRPLCHFSNFHTACLFVLVCSGDSAL
jgi:hypothetical protein